jgi:hypothetical protein
MEWHFDKLFVITHIEGMVNKYIILLRTEIKGIAIRYKYIILIELGG